MKIDWDEKKNRVNIAKHGVSFREAASIFQDPLQLDIDDPDHSWDENRFVVLGSNKKGKLLVVCFTFRGDAIRIISVRKPTSKEIKNYEKRIRF